MRVTLILLILCCIITFVLYAVFMEFTTPVKIFAFAAIILIVVYVISSRKRISGFMATRKAKHGLTSLIYTFLILGILILLNILGYKHKVVKDMTEDKLFTLSEQTLKILHGLDTQVNAYAFFTESNEQQPYVKHTLDQYSYQTKNFTYKIIDPDSFPSLANTYSVTKEGTIVFEAKDKRIQITEVSEQAITSGIIKALAKKEKRAAYITGHGESTFEPSENRSCSKLVKYLQHDNFKVDNVILTAGKTDLSKFDLVVIAGPYGEFLAEEIKLLTDYMNKGGNFLLLLDPFPSFGFEDFLRSWNIKLGRDLIIDAGSPYWADTTTPAVVTYPDEVITRNLPLTFYPHVRSLQIYNANDKDITLKLLVKSSADSWAETSPKDVHFDEDEDIKGPVPIAYLAEKEVDKVGGDATKSRIVVFGDSDFALDHFIDIMGNKDIILNCAEYMTGEEDLISIRPKELKDRSINLSSYQFALIKLLSMFVIPVFFIVMAVMMWIKKR